MGKGSAYSVYTQDLPNHRPNNAGEIVRKANDRICLSLVRIIRQIANFQGRWNQSAYKGSKAVRAPELLMIIAFPANAPPTAREIKAMANVFDNPKVNVQRMIPVKPTIRVGLRPQESEAMHIYQRTAPASLKVK